MALSNPGCRVEVAVGEEPGGGSLAVRDNGIGMDSEQVAQLFEPFNRLGRHGGKVSGAGLGLAITASWSRR